MKFSIQKHKVAHKKNQDLIMTFIPKWLWAEKHSHFMGAATITKKDLQKREIQMIADDF